MLLHSKYMLFPFSWSLPVRNSNPFVMSRQLTMLIQGNKNMFKYVYIFSWFYILLRVRVWPLSSLGVIESTLPVATITRWTCARLIRLLIGPCPTFCIVHQKNKKNMIIVARRIIHREHAADRRRVLSFNPLRLRITYETQDQHSSMASPSSPGLLALQLEPSRALVRITWNGCRPAQFWFRINAP